MAVSIGTRLHGAVEHVITNGMNTPCGRAMSKIHMGPTGKRMCRSCVRVNGDARRIDDARRKAERDARLRAGTAVPEQAVMSWSYSLTAWELEVTQEKIAKINARCAKRGVPGGLTVDFEIVTRTEKNDLGIEIEYTVYETKITGIAPQIPGWSFIGTLDYDQHAGLIIRAYPNAAQINRSLVREGHCDHCQVQRYRKSTFVVRNDETGEQVQVGSSCIKDFTGWTAMPYNMETMQKDMDGIEGGYGSSRRDPSTRTVLAVAWACVTQRGFTPKSAYEGLPTAHLVSDVIYPPRPDGKNASWIAELKELAVFADSMYERADALREWIASDEFSGTSDFVINMKALAKADQTSSRHFGTLCYAPQAFAKFQEKTLIREREKAVPSEWFGEIGERWELSLTLKGVTYIESFYGSTAIHTFTDATGNAFKWFASSADFGGHEGELFHVSAGIKCHTEWKGNRETGLTRVKEIDDVMTPAKLVKAAPIKVKEEMPLDGLTIDRNGVYFNADSQTYFRIRIQKGTAYAVKHTADGWTYSPGSVRLLGVADKLTAEQAAQFGIEHGQCVYCGKALTDERSAKVGYGETCAATHDLPWGE